MGTEYFSQHPIIGVLSNLPVLVGACAMMLLAVPRFVTSLTNRPAAWIFSTFFLTRILFLFLVVVVFDHISLDLSTYFEAQGHAVLSGDLPYRDFKSSYGPLFPYLMALPAAAPGHALPFFLFFILCDGVAVLTLCAIAAGGDGSRTARVAWLYVTAPITWYFLVRYGQDEALGALLLIVAYHLFTIEREKSSAIVLALGFAVTKFTFGIFLPPFFLAARDRRGFTVALAATTAALFAPFLLAGAPVLAPLAGESGGLGFGPSLWRLPVVFTSLTVGWPVSLALGAALIGAWFLPRLKRPVSLSTHLLLTGCVFLILSPKVTPMYAAPFWAFACLWLTGPGRRFDLATAALWNLLLGVWWYFDAGGIQGAFGPWVTALAVAITGLIPIVTAVIGWRSIRAGSGEPDSDTVSDVA